MVKSKNSKTFLSTTDRKVHVGRAFSISFGKADRAARHRPQRCHDNSNGYSNEAPHPLPKGPFHKASALFDKAVELKGAGEPAKNAVALDVAEKVKELAT